MKITIEQWTMSIVVIVVIVTPEILRWPGKGEFRLKKADRAGDAVDSPGVI